MTDDTQPEVDPMLELTRRLFAKDDTQPDDGQPEPATKPGSSPLEGQMPHTTSTGSATHDFIRGLFSRTD